MRLTLLEEVVKHQYFNRRGQTISSNTGCSFLQTKQIQPITSVLCNLLFTYDIQNVGYSLQRLTLSLLPLSLAHHAVCAHVEHMN